MNNPFSTLLLDHALRYPLWQPQDAVKLLFQSCLGSGHLGIDPARTRARLETERRGLPAAPDHALCEAVGVGLCRLYLDAPAAEKIPTETFNRLFLSAARPDDAAGRARLDEAVAALRNLAEAGQMPFPTAALDAFLADWRAAGCPAVSHSEAYRAAYCPAYRLADAADAAFLPLLAAIDARLSQNPPLAVGIDGRCGSGKTALADRLARLYDGQIRVIRADDFFLPPALRTPQRLAEPGGNFDRDRFAAEVLPALQAGKTLRYGVFDCAAGRVTALRGLAPKPLSVVEGSYSLHPAFENPYGLRVFLTLSPQKQAERLLAREGATGVKPFFEKWIPLEEAYFAAFAIEKSADFVFDTGL